MDTINATNSTPYWDTRFTADWETLQGPRQSRFFARIAIERLPHWLMDQIRQCRLTLADWGCAQGDGSDVWAGFVPADQIVGVDFSSVAIGQATGRYPAIRFLNEDWVAESDGRHDTFDVLFSSNTLEHFHRPYEVLARISARARKAIVLTLPYRELDRSDEHFFSFLPENIPAQLPNGFGLVWSKVVDCAAIPGAPWSLHQIVLVYVAPNWIADLALTLNHCHVEHDDPALRTMLLERELIARREEIVQLSKAMEATSAEIANLAQAAHARNDRIARLAEQVGEQDVRLQAADVATGERDIHIASLRQELEMRSGGLSGVAWGIEQWLRQSPHYMRRSRQLLATGGPAALMQAVREKVRRKRGAARLQDISTR